MTLPLDLIFTLSTFSFGKPASVRNSIIQHYDNLLETDDNAIIKQRTDYFS